MLDQAWNWQEARRAAEAIIPAATRRIEEDDAKVVRVMSIFCRILTGAGHKFRLRVSDWFLACMMTTFAVVLLLPEPVFPNAPALALLARMGTEQTWGYACLAVGVIRLAALVINGTFPAFRWSPAIRFVAATLSCFVWFQITLALVASSVLVPGFAVYPWLLLFDVYNAFLAASEAGQAERKYRDGGK